MNKLIHNGLNVLLAIVKHGTLRAAASELGVQPPTVTQQLKAFEAEIGVTLFARTTRAVHLTEAGRALLRRAQPAVAELSGAIEEARGVGHARSGGLRLSIPHNAYKIVLEPKLAAFHQAYPDIEIELSFEEGLVDIVAEGFHAGIRLGNWVEQDMIPVRLTPSLQSAYFGAPDYFACHGVPESPVDLLRHNCIRYRFIASKQIADWQFTGPDGDYAVKVSGTLILDNFQAVMEAAIAGLGIGWALRPAVAEYLDGGRLQSVLEAHVNDYPGFFLYYPRENARMELLRLFIDFMRYRADGAG